eukprot:CAMPEP_0170536684 /NCGR_PEP_ID=MMETSP0209-20121228/102279_1 /TAXON_ID=665100 ORGANISM="Litonotus pictus, Strain P1" /NCGR_SAMPLE_ID=MMETSP0209 /ASSEMBLY_ACC=CAM_ASM_000301 /LENGTH=934 /DNA_ID=CAMNT_0010838071 /DNA_START=6023 /DNA_END=8824 /DNA_ORIENTATION=-
MLCENCQTGWSGSKCHLNQEELLSFKESLPTPDFSGGDSLDQETVDEVRKISAIIEEAPELLTSEMLDQLMDLTVNEINKMDVQKKDSSVLLYELMDSTLNIVKVSNSDTDVSQIKKGISDITDLLINQNYISQKNYSMMFVGKTFSIQISNNTQSDIDEARANNLPIVDYEACKKQLKALGKVPEEESLLSVNTKFHFSLENSKGPKDNNSSLLQSASPVINTKLIDSNSNEIDTSLCSNIEVKLPVNKDSIDYEKYVKINNTLGIDIFNKSSPFFYDICFVFTDENNTDITLSKRREMLNLTGVCSNNCEYNGLDEHGYSSCLCGNHTADIISYFENSVFDSLTDNNLMLFTCSDKAFDKSTLLGNVGFWTMLFLTALAVTAIVVNLLFYSPDLLDNNMKQVVFSDANFGLVPQSTGMGNVLLTAAKDTSPGHVHDTTRLEIGSPLRKMMKDKESLQYNIKEGGNIVVDLKSASSSLRNSVCSEYNVPNKLFQSPSLRRTNPSQEELNNDILTLNSHALSENNNSLNTMNSLYTEGIINTGCPSPIKKRERKRSSIVIEEEIIEEESGCSSFVSRKIEKFEDNMHSHCKAEEYYLKQEAIENTQNKIQEKLNQSKDPQPELVGKSCLKNKQTNNSQTLLQTDAVVTSKSDKRIGFHKSISIRNEENVDKSQLKNGKNLTANLSKVPVSSNVVEEAIERASTIIEEQPHFTNNLYRKRNNEVTAADLIFGDNNDPKVPEDIPNEEGGGGDLLTYHPTTNQNDYKSFNVSFNNFIVSTETKTPHLKNLHSSTQSNLPVLSHSKDAHLYPIKIGDWTTKKPNKKLDDLTMKDIKTRSDYDDLPIKIKIKLDKRNFWEYLWDEMKYEHNFLNLFFLKSLIRPFWLRIVALLFEYSLELALNSVFFSSDIINKEAETKFMEGEEAIGFLYIITNEFW